MALVVAVLLGMCAVVAAPDSDSVAGPPEKFCSCITTGGVHITFDATIFFPYENGQGIAAVIHVPASAEVNLLCESSNATTQVVSVTWTSWNPDDEPTSSSVPSTMPPNIQTSPKTETSTLEPTARPSPSPSTTAAATVPPTQTTQQSAGPTSTAPTTAKTSPATQNTAKTSSVTKNTAETSPATQQTTQTSPATRTTADTSPTTQNTAETSTVPPTTADTSPTTQNTAETSTVPPTTADTSPTTQNTAETSTVPPTTADTSPTTQNTAETSTVPPTTADTSPTTQNTAETSTAPTTTAETSLTTQNTAETSTAPTTTAETSPTTQNTAETSTAPTTTAETSPTTQNTAETSTAPTTTADTTPTTLQTEAPTEGSSSIPPNVIKRDAFQANHQRARTHVPWFEYGVIKNEIMFWFMRDDEDFFLARVYTRFRVGSMGDVTRVYTHTSDVKVWVTPFGKTTNCATETKLGDAVSGTLSIKALKLSAFIPKGCDLPETSYYACAPKVPDDDTPTSKGTLGGVLIAGIILGTFSAVGIVWLGARRLYIAYSAMRAKRQQDVL
ncbi:mucin-5AC-like isoform X2 [Thrips palmi]|uniref:Mucin-5AC-like isoform X2 n=1 Tax=Thrips palmi TaxID=161013 RepID=A0A6P8ZYF8_THRPL|nr:mucin-5AC-like isoform X2 [Thrips palmi]